MTVALCTAVCGQNNQKYAGLEYANECCAYPVAIRSPRITLIDHKDCANSFTGGGAPAPDGFSGCNMPCSGNSSEFCGGSYRLNMYQAPGTGAQPISKSSSSTAASSTAKASSTVIPSTTSKTTSSSAVPTTAAASTTKPASTTASPTSAAPTTSASTAAGLPSGWAYKGCYIDGANGRDLPYQFPDNSSLTVESCVAACYQRGYSVAAMEYSVQCFCGNAIYSGGKLASSDSDCNMPCGGNAKENCGAGNRLSTYSNGTITTYAPAVAQTSGLPGSWTYDGCYK